MNALVLFLILLLAVALVLGGQAFARLLAPKAGHPMQDQPYECGVTTIGDARIRFHAGYYLVALLFLVFDVEAAFLYPWALAQRMAGLAGLIEVTLFIGILLLALVYAWKKGALEWL